MKIWIAIGVLMATTVSAHALCGEPPFGAPGCIGPEIDAFSGMAAIGVVASIGALIWERGRKRHS